MSTYPTKTTECVACHQIRPIPYSSGICRRCYDRQRTKKKSATDQDTCIECGTVGYVKYKSTGQCSCCYLATRRYRSLGINKKDKVRDISDKAHKCKDREGHDKKTCLNCIKRQERIRKKQRKAQGFKNPTGETRSGNCEVCNNYQAPLCLDHCHKSGETRGWICSYCNKALGFARDSQQTLNALSSYLEKYK